MKIKKSFLGKIFFIERKIFFFFPFFLAFGFLEAQTGGYNPAQPKEVTNTTPQQLQGVDALDRRGQSLDLSLLFQNERGELKPLSSFFIHQKPVLLSVVYYSCPNLCNYHLNGLLDVFKKMDMKAGLDFHILAVSMNHKETPELAHKKKENYLKAYGVPGVAEGWNFLVGQESPVKNLTSQLGFQFHWDEASQQYAHAAVAYVLTPQGKISQVLYGIEFSPQTLKLAMVEAGEGKVGSLVDRLLLYCFQFNSHSNKYTLYAFNLVKIAGLFMIVALGLLIVPVWIKERKLFKV